MGENRVLTVIVARPGPLREGIEALLASVAQVEIVGKSEFASSALSIAAECRVDLLLLDAGLPADAVMSVLHACRRRRPKLRCIALADNAAQEQAARDLGADAVFLKGYPAAQFVETVEGLLSSLTHDD
mgnify:FL=1